MLRKHWEDAFDKSCSLEYYIDGRARRGASGALYPKSAIAGLKSALEGQGFRYCLGQVVLKVGSRAADSREPGQVREEAAISGVVWATRECLAGAG